jgi:hypothetical protein
MHAAHCGHDGHDHVCSRSRSGRRIWQSPVREVPAVSRPCGGCPYGAAAGDGSEGGGARPKANFTDEDGSLWIAKFLSREDRRDIGALEMVTHALAQKAGIDVPLARVLKLGSRHRTFACRRFDRTDGGRRRFFVSALTLLDRQDGQGGTA